MDTQSTTPSVWHDHWANEPLTPESVRKMVRREWRTCRWKATASALKQQFGRLAGLKTLELGSGKGDVSLLLAMAGAEVTLLDSEKTALQRAADQFGHYGLPFRAVPGSIFDLPVDLPGRFDAAISWGVVEHFPRPAAFQACLAHRQAVHAGGMVIISVPNSRSLPYRLNKWYRHRRGTWKWGLELPFAPAELKDIGRRLELSDIRVHGSPVIRDLDQFLFHPIMGRLEKHLGLRTEVPTPADRFLGHALTLFGRA